MPICRTVSEVIHEKLKEEIFGKIAKNLKWIKVIHNLAMNAIQNGRSPETDVYGILFERISSAEESFSTAFVPILTYFYSHKYEVSEIFGKYVTKSYELARFTKTTALVTEEFWQETLPDEAVNAYADSEKRIVEILVPRTDDESSDMSILARYMYVAARNLTANVEQLAVVFKDDPDVTSFVGLLRPRIVQIEDGSLTLYKSLVKSGAGTTSAAFDPPRTKSCEAATVGEKEETTLNSLISLKNGKSPKLATKRKWVWDGRVRLTQQPEVVVCGKN